MTGPVGVVHRTHATDGDEFMLAVPGINGQLVRTGSGDEARVAAAQLGPMHVARLELDFPAAAEAVAADDHLVVATILEAPNPGTWDGVTLAPGQTFVYPVGSRHHAADPAGLHFVMGTIPCDVLEQAARTLGLDPGPANVKRVVQAGPLWSTAARVSDGILGPLGGLDTLVDEDLLVDSVVRTVCAPSSTFDDVRRSRWDDATIADDALAYIERQRGWVVPTLTLCREVGVSDRRLQLAFARTLGISPLAYMRHRALQAAHRALRDAPPGSTLVADVARAHGFGHVGRFAGFHASVYGEPPAAVLARPPRSKVRNVRELDGSDRVRFASSRPERDPLVDDSQIA